MIGADAIVRAIEDEGVELVFGYPGGAIMPLFDRLLEAKFKTILPRHEQGGALAADGYARATGRVGVCIATSGPGATNLVTGIANAYLDSVPMVCITGQVGQPLIGTDAFQEVDIFGLCFGIVKHSYIARRGEDLYAMVRRAFELARSGRPGPVLIDLPKDVSLQKVSELVFQAQAAGDPLAPRENLRAALALLKTAQRPVIYAGGGIGIADAVEEFRSFAHATRAPVVATLKGLGSMEADDPQFLGMLGMHGMKAANYAVHEADLLIAVGARFDDRATGKLLEFAPGAAVIHLDIDAAEMSKLRQANVSLCGSLTASLGALSVPLAIEPWLRRCQDWKAAYSWDYAAPGDAIYAPRLLQRCAQLSKKGRTIVTADVGQHQMWVAQHYPFDHPRDHLTSGGLGTMGFGLPAAIGAQFGEPEATVICVSGDGSIMMNIQELATLHRYQLPVKILLFDNQRLGMVRQWQEIFFEERYSATDLSDNPDFVLVARAFGVAAMRIESRDEEEAGLKFLLETEGPCLLHVRIDPSANVWPLVPPGVSNFHMMEG